MSYQINVEDITSVLDAVTTAAKADCWNVGLPFIEWDSIETTEGMYHVRITTHIDEYGPEKRAYFVNAETYELEPVGDFGQRPTWNCDWEHIAKTMKKCGIHGDTMGGTEYECLRDIIDHNIKRLDAASLCFMAAQLCDANENE